MWFGYFKNKKKLLKDIILDDFWNILLQRNSFFDIGFFLNFVFEKTIYASKYIIPFKRKFSSTSDLPSGRRGRVLRKGKHPLLS